VINRASFSFVPDLRSMDALIYGFGTGMILSVMLGTVFFTLIQNSIDNGILSSIFIIAGVIFSDVLMITVGHFNAQLIPPGGTTEMIVRMLGAAFLLIYGVLNLTGSKHILYPKSGKRNISLQFTKGFLLNLLNPGNFIAWLAIATQLSLVFNYTASQANAFYFGALSAIFINEIIISYSASKLKRFFNEQLLNRLGYVIGVIFIGFAIYLLIPVVKWMF